MDYSIFNAVLGGVLYSLDIYSRLHYSHKLFAYLRMLSVRAGFVFECSPHAQFSFFGAKKTFFLFLGAYSQCRSRGCTAQLIIKTSLSGTVVL